MRATICRTLSQPGLRRKADRFVTASMTDLGRMVAIARELEPGSRRGRAGGPAVGRPGGCPGRLGIACFGPTRHSPAWRRASLGHVHSSAVTASKATHAIGPSTTPTGWRTTCDELGTVVVKPDGLTGGKGVKVQGEQLASLEDAVAYALDRCLMPTARS